MGFIRKIKSMIGQQIHDADASVKFNSSTIIQAHDNKSSAYSEPKRIALLRAREFDQLRAVMLKNDTGSSLVSIHTASSKKSHSKSHHPEKTLKKIDEIEAEMSQLWWKTVRLDFSKAKLD